jgi:hypothetical protein
VTTISLEAQLLEEPLVLARFVAEKGRKVTRSMSIVALTVLPISL